MSMFGILYQSDARSDKRIRRNHLREDFLPPSKDFALFRSAASPLAHASAALQTPKTLARSKRRLAAKLVMLREPPTSQTSQNPPADRAQITPVAAPFMLCAARLHTGYVFGCSTPWK
jgi:hypothetical protein